MTDPSGQGDPIDPAIAPALSWSGSLIPGTAVTVSTPAYAVEGVTTSYAWQLSADGSTWTTVADDTTDSFTPTLTEAGEQVRAIVTGTAAGYADPSTTVKWRPSSTAISLSISPLP